MKKAPIRKYLFLRMTWDAPCKVKNTQCSIKMSCYYHRDPSSVKRGNILCCSLLPPQSFTLPGLWKVPVNTCWVGDEQHSWVVFGSGTLTAPSFLQDEPSFQARRQCKGPVGSKDVGAVFSIGDKPPSQNSGHLASGFSSAPEHLCFFRKATWEALWTSVSEAQKDGLDQMTSKTTFNPDAFSVF